MRRGITLITLISVAFSPCFAHAKRWRNVVGEGEIIDRVIFAAPRTLIAREDLGQVEAAYMGSKSVFDTNVNAELDYTRDEFARSSRFFGTRQDTTNWDVGLSKKLPIGTEASLDWLNQRNRLFGVPVIQGQTVFPNFPTYESILQFSVSHPMMKNFAGLNDRSGVAAAKKALESADLETKYRIATITRDALAVYWQWVISYALMSSWGRAVMDAQNFLHITLERRRLGTVEDTDVLAARANLIGKRNGLLAARRRCRMMEKDLKIVLGYPEDQHYSPRDKYPRHLRDVYLKKYEAIEMALENRWDYLAMQEEVARQNIRVVSAKNKRWPELDLVGTLAVNNLTPSYSNTMSGVDNPLWTVGMTFSVPLENRAARSEYKKVRHEKAKAVIRLKEMENNISNTISELIHRININRQVVSNAQAQQRMQTEKLYQELDKYRMGRSSSELIIIYQNDRLESEIITLSAWGDYLRSVLDLKLAENTLVDL